MDGLRSLSKQHAVQCMQRKFKQKFGRRGVLQCIQGVDCLRIATKKDGNIALAIFTNVMNTDIHVPQIGQVFSASEDAKDAEKGWAQWADKLLTEPFKSIKAYVDEHDYEHVYIVADKLYQKIPYMIDKDERFEWHTYRNMFSPLAFFGHVYQPDNVRLMTDEDKVDDKGFQEYAQDDPLITMYGFSKGDCIAIENGNQTTYAKVTNASLARTVAKRRK